MKVSILIPYYNRPRQLERSLWLLLRQTYPHDQYEIIIVDDGSMTALDYNALSLSITDYLRHIPSVWCYPIRPASSPPRSPNTALRFAYTKCSGDYIIVTCPEIMVPLHGVETMLAHGKMDRRNVPLLYCIAWNHKLSTVPWQMDLDSIQTLPDFMALRGEWGLNNYDMLGFRHHAGFTGATREVWEQMNPFLPDTEDWGRSDSYWHQRENELDLAPYPIDLTVYHQWHEPVHGNIPQYSHKIKQIRKSQMDDGETL